MKKIKLLAPVVGALTGMVAVMPAVGCSYTKKAETFKVSIQASAGDKFKLVNKDPAVENEAFESDITWEDEGKAVNVSTIKVTVGNQQLNRNDYSYANSTKQKKRGHIRINDGIINGDVVITLNLISTDTAPITLLNISDNTKFIKIEQSQPTTKVGDDLALKLTWDSTDEFKYYSNLITVYIGTKRVYQKSAEIPNGFYLTGYRLDGLTVNIPNQNITDNSEIIILIDLEVAQFADLRTLTTYAGDYVQWPIINPQYNYNVLKTPGYVDEIQGPVNFTNVSGGVPIEFYIDLNKWEGTGEDALDDNEDLLFAAGYWHYSTTYYKWIMTMQTMSILNTGVFYCGQKALEVEIDTESNAAIWIKAPDAGWSSLKDPETNEIPITGWFIYDKDYLYPQFLVGQISSTPIP